MKEEKKTIKKKTMDGEKKETRGRKKKVMSKVNLSVRIKKDVRKEKETAEEVKYTQTKHEHVVERNEDADNDMASRKARIIHEKEYRDKEIFLWLGVSVTMAVLLIVWSMSLKRQFQVAEIKEKDASLQWQEMSADLSAKMQQMKDDLDKVKEYNKQIKERQEAAKNATTTIAGATDENVVEELKEKIIMASTSATSSASTTGSEISATSSIEELRKILETSSSSLRWSSEGVGVGSGR